MVSELLAKDQTTLDQHTVFESLLSREKLGSTSLGYGVALPHGRISHSEETIGAFVQLEEGIDFDSIDNQPVDLLFALLVPEHSTDEHLQMLSLLAEMFSNEEFRNKLRSVKDSSALYQLLVNWSPHDKIP